MKKLPYVIGVTGTIGSGKSAVGSILDSLGVPVIDTDKVVHELFEENVSMRTAIHSRFGDSVITTVNGREQVDRTALGKIVFGDPDARRSLESIVHPATIEECRRRITEMGETNSVVAVLVPLLFEAKLEKQYDEIWAIFADADTLKKRIQARDDLSMQDVERRLAAQLPQEEKISRADACIDNSGSLEQTAKQVEHLLKKVKSKITTS